MVMKYHRQIDLDFIANMMLTIIKAKISINIVTIQASIHGDIEYDVSCHNMWIAKQKVLELLIGSHEELFQMLYRILLALKNQI